MDAKWKESFTIATECANLYALPVPKALTFPSIYRRGHIWLYLHLPMRSDDTLREC